MKKILIFLLTIMFIGNICIMIIWKIYGYYYGISPAYKHIVSKPLPFNIEPRYWTGFGIPIGMGEFDFDGYVTDDKSQYRLILNEFLENEPKTDSYKILNEYWSKREKILTYGYNDSLLIFQTIDSCDIIKYYESKCINTPMSFDKKEYLMTDKTVSKEYYNTKKQEVDNWIELYTKEADAINTGIIVVIFNLIITSIALIIFVFIYKNG